jgi:SAM-dependent methyltransferase
VNSSWGLAAVWFTLAALGIRQASLGLVQGGWIGAVLATVAVPVLRSFYGGGAGVGGELLAFYRDHLWSILAVLGVFLACAVDFRRWRPERAWQPRMAAFLMLMACVVAAVFVIQGRRRGDGNVLRASRNFYGTLKVFDYARDEAEEHYRLLMHGATTHGLQFFDPAKAMLPSTYYGEHSGVGLALRHLPRATGRKLGLVGLGTGTLAAYGRSGDQLRIYEINPAVEQLARDPFTHLARSPAKIDVVMGDARLSLEREFAAGGSQQFDLLALDAFSSDAIPVHLLTREAVALYLRHLRPDGMLAVHISNRYLNLEPVVRALAQEFGMGMVTIWMTTSRSGGFMRPPGSWSAATGTGWAEARFSRPRIFRRKRRRRPCFGRMTTRSLFQILK